jgi:hypothetical protein
MYVRHDILLYRPQISWMQNIATIKGMGFYKHDTQFCGAPPRKPLAGSGRKQLNAMEDGVLSNIVKSNVTKEGTCDVGFLLGCIRTTIPLMVNQGLDRRVYSFLCRSIELSRKR